MVEAFGLFEDTGKDNDVFGNIDISQDYVRP